MYEFGTVRYPIVIREISSMDIDGVTYNALTVSSKLLALLCCRRALGRKVFITVVPPAAEDNETPLAISDGEHYVRVYAPGTYTPVSMSRLHQFAGTSKLISIQLSVDDHFEPIAVLHAVHDVCPLANI